MRQDRYNWMQCGLRDGAQRVTHRTY